MRSHRFPAIAALAAFAVVGPAPFAAAADGTVTVSVTPTAPHVGEQVTVSGDVTDGSGQPVGGAPLSATRTDPDGTMQPVTVNMADATGHYSFTDTPPAYGQVTWTVTWQTTGVSGQQTVDVTRQTTQLSLDADHDRVRSGTVAQLRAHMEVRPDRTNRTVSIYAKPYRLDRRLVERGDVDAGGDLDTTFKVERRTRFVVRYDGDGTYAPAKDVVVVRARALIRNHLRGGYDRMKGFRIYHVGADATVVAHMRPEFKGACLRFRDEHFYLGRWHKSAVSDCIRTGSGGRAVAHLGGAIAVDDPYRVRAEWRGGKIAAAGHGRWLKLRFRG